MSNYDNFPPDDNHNDPGDDGLINNWQNIPPEVLWGGSLPAEIDNVDEFPVISDLLLSMGLDPIEAGLTPYGFIPAAGYNELGAVVRGTVYATPEEAFQAILDGGIQPFARVARTGDGFAVAVFDLSGNVEADGGDDVDDFGDIEDVEF